MLLISPLYNLALKYGVLFRAYVFSEMIFFWGGVNIIGQHIFEGVFVYKKFTLSSQLNI